MDNNIKNLLKKFNIIKWILPGTLTSKSLYNIDLPSKRRNWMDVNNKHAYKCLPLVVANGFGWEIKNPIKFTAVWNGSLTNIGAIDFNFYPETLEEERIVREKYISSHFGNGIITFSSLNFILKTSKGHNIFIKGPTNNFKHGAQALEAIVETDWLPYTFTLNWKITQPNIIIKFERGEPLACIFPFPRNYLESFEAIEVIGDSNTEFSKEHERWAKRRTTLNVDKNIINKDHLTYSKGIEKIETSEKYENHQKTITGCPFLKIFEVNNKENLYDTNKE